MNRLELKGIPKDETIWCQYKTLGGDSFCITSNRLRDFYVIYRLVEGKFEKLGKAATPDILEEKYIKSSGK